MKNKLQLHLIINENAGNGRGKKAAKKITTALTTKKIPFQTYLTHYQNHSSLLTQELLTTVLKPWPTATSDHYPLLVVLGGDGTLHEVINALGTHTDIPVGYIPCGSGNDFARGSQLSRKPLLALEQLLAADMPHNVNTLMYQDTKTNGVAYLTNNLGIGIDANIVTTANKSHAKRLLNRLHLGSLAYLFAATKVLRKQKGFPVDIHTPSERIHFDNAYLCTVTNHPYFGGGVAIAPLANVREEDMTLVIVEQLPLLKLLKLIIQLLNRKHLASPHLHQYKSTQLHITCQTPQYGQSDGEEYGLTAFDLHFTTQKRLFWL